MPAKFCMTALAALAVVATASGPVLAHGYSDHSYGYGHGYAHPYYGHGYAYAYPYHLRSYTPRYPFAMRRFMTDPDPGVRFDLNRDSDRGHS